MRHGRYGNSVIDKDFWKKSRVFITGHTGFKGGWLCLLLDRLGSLTYGYALPPPTDPSLFKVAGIGKFTKTTIGDINDLKLLKKAIKSASPEIVIHMAAQSLVRESYARPVDTYLANVMGTVNLLEAVRDCSSVRAVVNVTTDKCYENREWIWSYRENDQLGGYDPYSSSKACSEMVTSAYRNSFFHPGRYKEHGVAIASARAGNVIGGGDWAADRLIPDCMRAVQKNEKIVIRNPDSVRPWQYVLDPLTGYLMLAERLCKNGPSYGEAWNFGPGETDMKSVRWIAEKICRSFNANMAIPRKRSGQPHEASMLRLDSTKARLSLGWRPRYSLNRAVEMTIRWYQACAAPENMSRISQSQVEEYIEEA